MEASEEKVINKILKGLWLDSGASFREGFFELSPNHFLRFAKSDLNLKTKRSTVNALSNAKRAIECQVDEILYVLGHYKAAKRKDGIFRKIEFLKSLI